jgi:selenocysteine-specific elongation factor
VRVQPFILATAGHVDHGKSSLVKALTGTDPDRLPEEKARGITIDLGFAHLEVPASPGNPHQADRYSCGIVDVPGHEDFVRNMVAGVGSIDLALLVVAADDGWMPQTEEHLQILLYLGVTRAVVALTKSDLAPAPETVAEAVRSRLAGTPFAEAPIVPTSITAGTGFEELRQALASQLDTAPSPADLGRPRLWVDRVFVLRGIGTVVTGTLTGGCLERGQSVVAQPGSRPGRIRSCQSHGREAERLEPGTRAALNLSDLAMAANDSETGLRRGDVITTESAGPAVETLDVEIERSPRLIASSLPASKPLRNGARVHLHLGSVHIPARVQLLAGNELGPGQRGPAQLRLDHPAFAFAGDRFILRDPAQQSTLAGGTILDPDARQSRSREPDRVALLQACATTTHDPGPFIQLGLHREGVLASSTLLLRSRFPSRLIVSALGRLVAERQVTLAGSLIISAVAWNAARDEVRRTVEEHHRLHPEQNGPPLTELRALIMAKYRLEPAFEQLIRDLLRQGYVQQGTTLRHAVHQPRLPEALRPSGERIRTAIARQPLDPPSRRDLAPDPASQQALRYLLQSGELIELGPDVVLGSESFRTARERLRSFLARREGATTSELRQLLGTSRRVAIPLLEKLDREGFTRRLGDLRSLVSRPVPAHTPPQPPPPNPKPT